MPKFGNCNGNGNVHKTKDQLYIKLPNNQYFLKHTSNPENSLNIRKIKCYQNKHIAITLASLIQTPEKHLKFLRLINKY
jgi:hypothetical protein